MTCNSEPMNLKSLIEILSGQPDKTVEFKLPSKEILPKHLHVTEIGVVTKNFMDCGGSRRSTRHIAIQTWVASDSEHRLTTEKLLKILAYDDNMLTQCLDIVVEVQIDSISIYNISSVEYGSEFMMPMTINLGRMYTDCLAKDKCGIEEQQDGCCGSGGCC